jgi:glycine hydroxymethyltransferase
MQSRSLAEQDRQVYELLEKEQHRQRSGLELIASENFTSRAVMDAVGSSFTNKYSEGLPGARYYGGNEVIDELELLTIKRALTAFGLDENVWAVNVQAYSGSVANFAAFTAVLQPHDRVMGLDLPSGGHLSHGYYRGNKKINASSIYFESLPYKVSAETGLVDYEELEKLAKLFSPKLLVCGGSSYPRDWDYATMRKIADSVGALLLVDMAHYSGLVAGKAVSNPFQYAQIVTSTTHKSLRGPRAALIFSRKDHPSELDKKINFAVFPTVQGGPHNNAIAGICVQLAEVATPEFAEYARQVVANARALAQALVSKGYSLVSGGTDTHLVLWDLRPQGLTGSKFEAVCDAISVTLNKNSVYGDSSAFTPGGVRVGTPALTSRGFKENDFVKVADFLDRALKVSVELQKKSGSKLQDFKKAVSESEDIKVLKKQVEEFASGFYMPGF